MLEVRYTMLGLFNVVRNWHLFRPDHLIRMTFCAQAKISEEQEIYYLTYL